MNTPTRIKFEIEVSMNISDPYGCTPKLVMERIQKGFDYFIPILDARVIAGKGVIIEEDVIDSGGLLDTPEETSSLLDLPVSDLLGLPGEDLLQ